MAPSKLHNHYITGHGYKRRYKRRPGNFYWALFFHMWFSLLWKFYWVGARVHEYTKLRTVSLHDVNSLTCIALYFFLGRGLPLPQTSPPLDSNTVTAAAKCYKDNCHYVALIRIQMPLSATSVWIQSYVVVRCSGRCKTSRAKRYSIKCRIIWTK